MLSSYMDSLPPVAGGLVGAHPSAIKLSPTAPITAPHYSTGMNTSPLSGYLPPHTTGLSSASGYGLSDMLPSTTTTSPYHNIYSHIASSSDTRNMGYLSALHDAAAASSSNAALIQQSARINTNPLPAPQPIHITPVSTTAPMPSSAYCSSYNTQAMSRPPVYTNSFSSYPGYNTSVMNPGLSGLNAPQPASGFYPSPYSMRAMQMPAQYIPQEHTCLWIDQDVPAHLRRTCNKTFYSMHEIVTHITIEHVGATESTDHVCFWKDCERTYKPFKGETLNSIYVTFLVTCISPSLYQHIKNNVLF